MACNRYFSVVEPTRQTSLGGSQGGPGDLGERAAARRQVEPEHTGPAGPGGRLAPEGAGDADADGDPLVVADHVDPGEVVDPCAHELDRRGLAVAGSVSAR